MRCKQGEIQLPGAWLRRRGLRRRIRHFVKRRVLRRAASSDIGLGERMSSDSSIFGIKRGSSGMLRRGNSGMSLKRGGSGGVLGRGSSGPMGVLKRGSMERIWCDQAAWLGACLCAQPRLVGQDGPNEGLDTVEGNSGFENAHRARLPMSDWADGRRAMHPCGCAANHTHAAAITIASSCWRLRCGPLSIIRAAR